MSTEYFFQGWNSIGVPTQPEPNAGNGNGVFYGAISLFAKNQSRASANDAYYLPIAGKRPNFHLITEHAVSKINFDRIRTSHDGELVAKSVDVSKTSVPGIECCSR
jgi:choline dehydrogenase-like flavoprotein